MNRPAATPVVFAALAAGMVSVIGLQWTAPLPALLAAALAGLAILGMAHAPRWSILASLLLWLGGLAATGALSLTSLQVDVVGSLVDGRPARIASAGMAALQPQSLEPRSAPATLAHAEPAVRPVAVDPPESQEPTAPASAPALSGAAEFTPETALPGSAAGPAPHAEDAAWSRRAASTQTQTRKARRVSERARRMRLLRNAERARKAVSQVAGANAFVPQAALRRARKSDN
jgi:hypothetical protein